MRPNPTIFPLTNLSELCNKTLSQKVVYMDLNTAIH